MRKVLYVMYGMPSCYNSGFAFARKFSESNFEIKIACDRDVGDLADKAEIPFVHLQSISMQANLQRWQSMKAQVKAAAGGKILTVFRLLSAKRVLRRETLASDEIQRLVESFEPDLLLIDIECHVAIITSARLGIPTALCSRLFDHRPGGNCPPLHSNLKPSNALGARLVIAAQWQWLRVRSFFKAARQNFSLNRLSPVHYRTTQMPDIKALARQQQVNLWSIATTAHWFQPVAYTHLPVLSMTLGALDFDRGDRDGFSYVGPMINDLDTAFNFESAQVDDLEQFVANARSMGKTVVYCAMGTFANREPRFIEAMRSLALSRTDLALIIALGGREQPNDYPQFPANCLLLGVAPQLKCLEEADVAILHSGIASLQEALKYRVPTLIFAVDSMDQNGCAVRWCQHNLAKRFYLNSVTASGLAADLDSLLADKAMADRLEQFGVLIETASKNFSSERLFNKLTSNTTSDSTVAALH